MKKKDVAWSRMGPPSLNSRELLQQRVECEQSTASVLGEQQNGFHQKIIIFFEICDLLM